MSQKVSSPHPSSILHIVCGKPGSGKTTYGRQLALQNKAVFLDIDTVTEPVVKAGLGLAERDPDDRDSEVYKSTFRLPVYDALFSTAKENLPINSVVICGPFSKEIQNPQWPLILKEKFGCEVLVYFVQCTEQTRHERLIQRANPRDKSKLEDVAAHTGYYDGAETPACSHKLIKTD